MPGAPRLSLYFVVLAAVWVVVMTGRLYPQFKDTVRVDGHLVTVEDYIADACGERIGPAASTCFEEANSTAQELLRHEQSRSILLIEAPVILYFAIGVPLALWGRRVTRPS